MAYFKIIKPTKEVEQYLSNSIQIIQIQPIAYLKITVQLI
jgi:hypothetical protein